MKETESEWMRGEHWDDDPIDYINRDGFYFRFDVLRIWKWIKLFFSRRDMRLVFLILFLTSSVLGQVPCKYGTAKSDYVTLSNLALYSEQFDNIAWSKSNITVTANAAIAPDGTTTADKWTAGATGSAKYIYSTASVATVTVGDRMRVSMYAKKGNENYIQIYVQGSPGIGVNANLSTGVLSYQTSGVLSPFIHNVGSGWYRIGFEYLANITTTYPTITLIKTATAAMGAAEVTSGAEYYYVWGASAQVASNPSDYLLTTSAAATLANVCAEGTARDPDVFSKCLEVIPSTREIRTAAQIAASAGIVGECGSSVGAIAKQTLSNLTLYSEQLDNAAWTKSDVTVTADSIAAPDGTTTADKLTAGATASAKYVYPTASFATITSGQDYRFSIYVKKGNENYFQWYYQGTASEGINVDLSTGTVSLATTGVLSSSVEALSGGWYRISYVVTATNTILYPTINLIKTATVAMGTGETTSGAEYYYVWGASVQLVSNPSDYVPTTSANVSTTPTCGEGLTPAKFDPSKCVSVYNMFPEIRTAAQISGG